MKRQTFQNNTLILTLQEVYARIFIGKTKERSAAMSTDLNSILIDMRKDLDKALGDALAEMILYGSYARGNYDDESDVDIALLFNANREMLEEYDDAIMAIMNDNSLEHDKLFIPVCIPKKDFYEYVTTLPFYNNVNTEGVRIYAQ